LGLTFKFSALMADLYRPQLNEIANLNELTSFFAGKNFENEFLEYVLKNGVKVPPAEWEESKDILMNHVRAFIGRYTPLDDNGFYPVLLELDNMVKIAIEQ